MTWSDPIVIFAISAACALGIAVARVLRSKRRDQGPYRTPGVNRLAEQQRFAEGAAKASAAENWAEAMDLYLLAGQIGEAAAMAVKADRLKQAAELYEWAGDKALAAHYYAECGMDLRAEELRVVHGLGVTTGAPVPLASGEVSLQPQPSRTPRERADALLAAGDVRGAADELAAGGLMEDAAYLYVNVLGEPGPGQSKSRVPSGTPPAESDARSVALSPEQLALMVSQVAKAAAKRIRAQSVNDDLFAYRPPAQVEEAFEQAARDALQGLNSGWQQRYQILGELGRGGMAIVYRAHDKHLMRDVALKFINRTAGSTDLEALFLREARAVAALNHPNIITIFDSSVLDGKMFICMEYVEGRSVEHLLEDGALTVVESLRIIKQALDGLHYAHEKGVIHRDVKPANIMRTRDGRVKLMDFGIAKSVTVSEQASMIAGTPPYMPPEQLQGTTIDRRTDVFAVGVTLYEMLTRQVPFEGLDRSRVPRPVSALVPSLPAILDEIVERAIALDPAERWSTAQAMARPISAILAAISEYAAEPQLHPVTPPVATRPLQSR